MIKTEIINIGNELLLGKVVNSGAAAVAECLAAHAMSAENVSVVGDSPSAIARALKLATERSDIIILTGGLGATGDDHTKSAVATALGLELAPHEPTAERLRKLCADEGREYDLRMAEYALVPEGATVFANELGLAPGLAVSCDGQHILMLPGPPAELQAMLDGYVSDYLGSLSGEATVSHEIRLYGMGENEVCDRLGDIFNRQPAVGIYADGQDITLRVTATAETARAAERMCEPVVKFISAKLGKYVYSVDGGTLEEVVVSHLARRGLTLATAESCTAGLLSGKITAVSGSSEVFACGIAAYSAAIKQTVLGVPENIIEKYGTVSDEVARRMAMGARKVGESDLGIGITGVAGQPYEGKPSGLVYIALTDGTNIWVNRLSGGHTADEREQIRAQAVGCALDLVRRYLFALPEVLEGAETAPVATRMTFNPDAVYAAEADRPAAEPEISMSTDLPWPQEVSEPESAPEPQATPAAAAEQSTDADLFSVAAVTSDGSEFDIEQSDAFAAMWERSDSEQKKDTRPFGIRLLSGILPWRGDGPMELVRKALMLVCIAVLVVSVCYIGNSVNERMIYNSVIEAERELYNREDNTVGDDGKMNKFDKLYAANPDVVGWLTVPGTKTDNPVYQTKDNDYYLDHNSRREQSIYGALFADYRASIKPDERANNVTVYGHHMRDGSMLAELTKYKSLSFYKKNPLITFDTIYGNGTYKVFAAFITNDEPSGDNGYRFDFNVPNFASADDFNQWVEQVSRRSLLQTTVDVNFDDKILTLSTCTYDVKDVELRFVVMARLVREGESTAVNTADAKQNSKPLYPACWYQSKGGKKPTFSDGNYTWFPEGTDQNIIDNVNSNILNTSSATSPSTSSATSVAGSSGTSSGTANSHVKPPSSSSVKPSSTTASGSSKPSSANSSGSSKPTGSSSATSSSAASSSSSKTTPSTPSTAATSSAEAAK